MESVIFQNFFSTFLNAYHRWEDQRCPQPDLFLLLEIPLLAAEVSPGNLHHLHIALESFYLSPDSSLSIDHFFCQLKQTPYHNVYIACMCFYVHDYTIFFEQFHRQLSLPLSSMFWPAYVDLDHALQIVWYISKYHFSHHNFVLRLQVHLA